MRPGGHFTIPGDVTLVYRRVSFWDRNGTEGSNVAAFRSRRSSNPPRAFAILLALEFTRTLAAKTGLKLKKNMTARLLLFLFTCVCSSSMAAVSTGPMQIEFEAAKCKVRFTLGALLHIVHGSFKVKDSSLQFEPASGRASGQIVVDLKSGETGDEARDRQMHESVLESNRFSDAVFTPDRVNGRVAPNGDSQIEVHGSLRFHGASHSLTLPVRVNLQKNLVTATAKFVVPYVAWGLKDPSNLILKVDKTVKVEVELTGTAGPR